MKAERIKLTENEINMLLFEVDGFCPLCHKSIFEEKNGRSHKKYELAHIYPHSPTKEQLDVLTNVPRPHDVESKDNIIPLCRDCHSRQDYHTTVEDYMVLYVKKQECAGRYQAKIAASEDPLDSEVKDVVSALDNITETELAELAYVPVSIEDKIKEKSLCRKVKSNVAQYFPLVQAEFAKLDAKKTKRSTLIASQVKAHFLRIEQSVLLQEAMFDEMVRWFSDKTRKSRSACEIVVSYFVQNCEVFHALAK